MKSLLALLLSIGAITATATATSGDLELARQLEHEARELCGANCDETAELAALQARTGDVPASKKSFSRAWHAVAKMAEGPERRMVLHGLAELQAQAGQVKDAIESSKRLPSRYEQAMTLSAIALVQAERGDGKLALETIELMPAEETWQRNSTLGVVAMSFSERHDFCNAKRVLDRIHSDETLAEKIMARKRANPAGQINPQELAVVQPAIEKSSALAFIAKDQAKSGDRKTALQTAHAIRLQPSRDIGLRQVACIAADSGDLTVAEAALDQIEDEDQKNVATVRVVAALAKQGRFGQARDRSDAIRAPTAKATAFFQIAAAQAARGDAQAARALVKDAASLEPRDTNVQDAGLKLIVDACIKSRALELAVNFSRDVRDPATLSEALQAIGIANQRAKQDREARRLFAESREAAKHVVGSYPRCVRLRELAVAQFEAGEKEEAATTAVQALTAAREIEIGGGTDVIALTETATTQSKIGDHAAANASFKLARDAAARYPDEPYMAQLLQGVVGAQARAGEVAAAIEATRQAKSALSRACMLVGIANAILDRSRAMP